MSVDTPNVEELLEGLSVRDLIELALDRKGAEEPAPSPATFRPQGETWVLSFNGRTIYVKERLGLQYMSYLLANERESVSVISLYREVNRDQEDARARDARSPQTDQEWTGGNARATVTDRETLRACRERLREIEAERQEAKAAQDEARQLELDREAEQIERYLSAGTGRGGSLRRVADEREKIRKSVSNAITRAIDAIAEHHEPLARHLRNSVRTGYDVVYDPDRSISWGL